MEEKKTPRGSTVPSGSSRKSTGMPKPASTMPGSKERRKKAQENARTTLALESPQSPRRPAIDPQSDERLTQQRRQEDELLQAIESAMKCDDDARVEALRQQLKTLHRQSVELRKSVVSKDSANKLNDCRRKIALEFENMGSLGTQLRAAAEYVRDLEVRIEKSAIRTRDLEKELDALLAEARPET